MYSPNHAQEWYVKKKSKAIWRAFTSRSVKNNVLICPHHPYIYYQTNDENGYWLQNSKYRTSMEAALMALDYNRYHSHVTLYCVFSPCCKTNTARSLLEYLERKPKQHIMKPEINIYFSVIDNFRINTPDDWFYNNELNACKLLRKLSNQRKLIDFRPFGQAEWEFIANKLEIKFQYQEKSDADVWDMKSFGDEEYSELWNAIMEGKLMELKLKIYSKTNLATPTTRRHRLHKPRENSEADPSEENDENEKQEVQQPSKLIVVSHKIPDHNDNETDGYFCAQKGVEKRTRAIGRKEWKQITREATISANV